MAIRTVQATTFKATCLALLDEVADTGDELVITKRGKPVARVGPVSVPERIERSVTLLSEWTTTSSRPARRGMPTRDAVLLDTDALRWWQADAGRLSSGAAEAIASTERLVVCPISFREVAMLERKGRVALDRPIRDWCIAVGRDVRVDVVDISPSIAASAGSNADPHGDPADRLICATAMEGRLAPVTKDGSIIDWATTTGSVEIVW